MIPAMPDPFIGRDAMVDEVTRLLDTAQIVSLVGLGGIGKTTVAYATARRLAQAGRPVHICELATETVAQAAIERVCRDAGVDSDDPAGHWQAWRKAPCSSWTTSNRSRGSAHVLAGSLVGSRASVLVTSRLPLRVRAERVVRVGALPVEPEEGELSPAATFFLEFAARVQAGT